MARYAGWAMLLLAAGVPAQTLARPGWAGSGLTVSAWWRNAVLFEVSPGTPLVSEVAQSGPAAATAGPAVTTSGPMLAGLLLRLDDLQTLGADAMLLRNIDRGIDHGATMGGSGRVAETYGTMDQFDELLEQASRRRIRVLVELPASLDGEALRAAARFWLSRGVSGIYFKSATDGAAGSGMDAASAGKGASVAATAPSVVSDEAAGSDTKAGASGNAGLASKEAAQIRILREVLRSYVGERVLLENAGGEEPSSATASGVAAGGAAGGAPEMLLSTIRGFAEEQPVDVTAVRQSVAGAQGRSNGRRGVRVAEIDPRAPAVRGAAAEARAAVLLMAAGGVALRTGEAGEGPEAQAAAAAKLQEAKDVAALAGATSPAAVSNVKRAIAQRQGEEPPRFAGDAVFQWTARMIGLHRGSPAMLLGTQTLLDHDKEGAVVSVWRGRGGQVLCEVVNLRDAPVELTLAQEFTAMHERGSFLRPVARTDAGMGAMPLARVKLPAFGVFLGELGR